MIEGIGCDHGRNYSLRRENAESLGYETAPRFVPVGRKKRG
jgi:hypothetical protein